MNRSTLIALWAMIFMMLCTASALPQAKQIRILILSGPGENSLHASQEITTLLKRELEDAGIFQVSVGMLPKSGNVSNLQSQLNSSQVVLLDGNSSDWPTDLRQELERYVEGGGGLVIVHAGASVSPEWPALNRMMGISNGSTQKGLSGPVRIETRDAQNPIMRGLPRVWMHPSDEIYESRQAPDKNVDVLATGHLAANGISERDAPILLVGSYGKGRVFHSMMGNNPTALSCVGFITTLQRGAEWAATGKVTQRVPITFPTATTSSVRVDLAEIHPKSKIMAGDFDELGDSTLLAMRKRADELKVKGVAVVAYFDGNSIESWISKMAIVGTLKRDSSGTNPGMNLLAVAYSKAAEMADTMKDSGSRVRPPMTGEYGWTGGIIIQANAGYYIVAFSGGKSDEDVRISRAGVGELKGAL